MKTTTSMLDTITTASDAPVATAAGRRFVSMPMAAPAVEGAARASGPGIHPTTATTAWYGKSVEVCGFEKRSVVSSLENRTGHDGWPPGPRNRTSP